MQQWPVYYQQAVSTTSSSLKVRWHSASGGVSCESGLFYMLLRTFNEGLSPSDEGPFTRSVLVSCSIKLRELQSRSVSTKPSASIKYGPPEKWKSPSWRLLGRGGAVLAAAVLGETGGWRKRHSRVIRIQVQRLLVQNRVEPMRQNDTQGVCRFFWVLMIGVCQGRRHQLCIANLGPGPSDIQSELLI